MAPAKPQGRPASPRSCREPLASIVSLSTYPKLIYRKTKTKAITMTNHNNHKQRNEPMKTQRKYKKPLTSAGKRVRPSSNRPGHDHMTMSIIKKVVVQNGCQKWKEHDEISKVANFILIHTLSISGNHFVLPPNFMIDMVM